MSIQSWLSVGVTSTKNVDVSVGVGARTSEGSSLLDGTSQNAKRLLVVDDNPDIHDDFRKVLGQDSVSSSLVEAEAALLGQEPESTMGDHYELDCVSQGLDAVVLVERKARDGEHYCLAFIDIRMPPGIDGVHTARQLWAVDPLLQVVFCTAYSDYSWGGMVRELGRSHNFLVLKKPFDTIEVRQVTLALCEKRRLLHENELAVSTLEQRVRQRSEQLERAHAHLQKELLDRLSLEQGLRQAQKLEALGRLAAGIGHDINNPLTYILNNLEFLRHRLPLRGAETDPAEGEAILNALDDCVLGAQRIRQLVRATRQFALTRESPPTEADVSACIRAAIAMVKCELRHKAVLIEDISAVPPVVGDSPRLEQVFVNLLLNAIQAIPRDRSRTAEIRISVASVAKGMVEVSIGDNGCGIAETDLAQAFSPSFSTKPGAEGTGIGLWVCKNIIETFGGHIAIESAVGIGTIVRLQLPAADRTIER
jgi:two-component system, NtrC family, sensor kinase